MNRTTHRLYAALIVALCAAAAPMLPVPVIVAGIVALSLLTAFGEVL